MNCRKICNLLSAYMDGELLGVEHRQIHDHLSLCTECRAEYEGLLQTKRLLSRLKVQPARAELPALILQNVHHEEVRRAERVGNPWKQMQQWVRDYNPSPRSLAVCGGFAVIALVYMVSSFEAADDIVWAKAKPDATALLAPDARNVASVPQRPVGAMRVMTSSSSLAPSVEPVTNSMDSMDIDDTISSQRDRRDPRQPRYIFDVPPSSPFER